jgi:hypothetical protein
VPPLLDEPALALLLDAPPVELLEALLPAGLAPPAPPLLELDDPIATDPPPPPAPPLEELAFLPASQPAATAIDNPAISATLRPLTKGHLRNNCKSGSHYMGTPRT